MKPSIPAFFLFAFLFSLSILQAQTPSDKCSFDKERQKLIEQDPKAAQLEQQIAAVLKQQAQETDGFEHELKVIPIFFHIFHNGGNASAPGDNNFTNVEIQAAVDRLNEVYAGFHPGLFRTQDTFSQAGHIARHTNFQFCWDPANIRRTDYSQPLVALNLLNPVTGRIRNDVDWVVSPNANTCSFLNIYIGPYGITLTSTSGTLGYALTNSFNNRAGVRIDDNCFVPGSPLTLSFVNRGMTLAHEVGHWFGLSHPWGPVNIGSTVNLTDSTYCNIDDGFLDTPTTGRPSDTIPIKPFVKNKKIIQCGNPIMWTNIMDYPEDPWLLNFTPDQVKFMHLFYEAVRVVACAGTPGPLNGFISCSLDSNDCKIPMNPVFQKDTFLCAPDTINLLQIQKDWGLDASVSPLTKFHWRRETLTGPRVSDPSKVFLQPGFIDNLTCAPKVFTFQLEYECVPNGNFQHGGTVTVKIFRDPNQMARRLISSGDCQDGPVVAFSAADSLAGCDTLITITALNPPALPTSVPGEVYYKITFDSLVLGPCYDADTVMIFDTAAYNCINSAGACGGAVDFIDFAAGDLCPGTDVESEVFPVYEEGDSWSLFNPNGTIKDVYYFSDVERTDFWEESDLVYEDPPFNDSCLFGSTQFVYTAFGCDLEHDGIINFYIPIGNILITPVPAPQEPTIIFTQDEVQDCFYEIIKACPADDITPPTIPVEVCGAEDLGTVELSVLTDYGCETTFEIPKPDCPACLPTGLCVLTDFIPGGFETICHGEVPDLPPIEVIASEGTVLDIFWALTPYMPGEPLPEAYAPEADDNPSNPNPLLHPDPFSQAPMIQPLFAIAICESDNDIATPPEVVLLGDYFVEILPPPLAQMVPVCDLESGDSLNFYVEIEVPYMEPESSFFVSNSLDATTLTISMPELYNYGPFANDSSVVVTIAADNGCSVTTDPFSVSCLSSSCQDPDISFSPFCMEEDSTSFFVEVALTNNNASLQYFVANDENDQVFLLNAFFLKKDTMGPFEGTSEVTIEVFDYTNPNCSTSSDLLKNPCDGEGGCPEVFVISAPLTEDSICVDSILESTAVLSSGEVEVYKARVAISLKPGMEVSGGSTLHALIEDCCPVALHPGETITDNRADEAPVISQPQPEPREISLEVFPNPFRSQTTIQFETNQNENVSLTLFNAVGQIRKTLIEGREMDPGIYSLVLEQDRLDKGIYYLVLQSNGNTVVKKVLIL